MGIVTEKKQLADVFRCDDFEGVLEAVVRERRDVVSVGECVQLLILLGRALFDNSAVQISYKFFDDLPWEIIAIFNFPQSKTRS